MMWLKRLGKHYTTDERISEVLFGLIMTITFTGSLRIAGTGGDAAEQVNRMLIAALSCNLAWGIIDAVMYLMSRIAQKGRELNLVRQIRETKDGEAARGYIRDALPPTIASIMLPKDLDVLHDRLAQLPEPPRVARLVALDYLAAIAVFLLVFLATFPMTIPFILMSNVTHALRASHSIAIIMLFGLGFIFGRHAGRNPWLYALAMVVVGSILAIVTMVLGG